MVVVMGRFGCVVRLGEVKEDKRTRALSWWED